MGRMVVTESISVDGVVKAPSGVESVERVGWTDAFKRGPVGDGCASDGSGEARDDSWRKEE